MELGIAKELVENAKKQAEKIISESEVLKKVQKKAIEIKDDVSLIKEKAFGTLVLTSYEATKRIPGCSTHWAVKQENHKWGIIKSNGDIVSACIYDDVISFVNGADDQEELIVIRINNKFGYINPEGDEVIPAEYERVSPFFNGKAEVAKNGETFYINIDNDRIQ